MAVLSQSVPETRPSSSTRYVVHAISLARRKACHQELLVLLYGRLVHKPKAPVHWFLVSFQVIPLHTMWAGITIMYLAIASRYFSQQNPQNMHDVRRISTHHTEEFFWMLCSRKTCLLALRLLLCLSGSLLHC